MIGPSGGSEWNQKLHVVARARCLLAENVLKEAGIGLDRIGFDRRVGERGSEREREGEI